MGLTASVSYTTFNHYFVEKRIFMMSVVKSMVGVGIMVSPLLAQFFMENFGFRGGMAMIAAINGHVIFGMIVMHPIEWHYKVLKIPVDETASCNEASHYSFRLFQANSIFFFL